MERYPLLPKVRSEPRSFQPGGRYVVAFIPGTLGAVACYREFLSILSELLHNSTEQGLKDATFDIQKHDFSNLEYCLKDLIFWRSSENPGQVQESMRQQQAVAVEKMLWSVADDYEISQQEERAKVILVGESAGACVALEFLNRLQSRRGLDVDRRHKGISGALDVVGAVLLFPAVCPQGSMKAFFHHHVSHN